MNKEEFVKSLLELGLKATDKELTLLEKYKDFLKEYNKHTNLTAITNDEDIYLKHFYDSLTICKVVNLNDYNNLLDIGSGAGFPGMILKIFFPNLEVTLLDSNNKKTKFLQELSSILNLKVNIVNDRVENFAKNNLNSFDIVTSRAVANLRVLSELSLPLVKVNGLFIPLKGKLDDTKENSLSTIKYFFGKIEKHLKFELYENVGTRNILIIRKLQKTEVKSLRSYDKIVKRSIT